MWKVCGIEIDFTVGRYFFFAGGHGKMLFFVKRSVTEFFFKMKICRDGNYRNRHGLSFQNMYMKGGEQTFSTVIWLAKI